jgi:acetyltransferase-like isoleucine patch superfamily enzyme
MSQLTVAHYEGATSEGSSMGLTRQVARARTALGVLSLVPLLLCKRVRFGRLPSVCGRRPAISNRGHMSVGDGLRLRNAQFRTSLSTDPGATLQIGDHAFINQGCSIHSAVHVSIGEHAMIGDLVAIYDTNFHQMAPGEVVRIAPVVIGRNVWIGRGVAVLPGVTIGDNAVIGAGSVVTHDVPEDVFAAGVPAVEVRRWAAPPGWVRS